MIPHVGDKVKCLIPKLYCTPLGQMLDREFVVTKVVTKAVSSLFWISDQ
jgi:hypothetical protein